MHGGVRVTQAHYRSDIDGLRAIAVLAVVLFHVDKSWAPGGFIGVDIFFVISGFLITQNILRDREGGRFSYAEFYKRRIKRLFPVLFFVIGTTLVAAHFIMLPEDIERLSTSAISSVLSIANVHFTFFVDTSYFAPAADLQPLIHLWSLGVEEQYYLIWPTLLIALWGIRKFWITFVAMAALAAGSIVLGEVLAPEHPMFAYYMLPTRAFQLLAGALVVLALRRFAPTHGALAAGAQILGLALITYSLWMISDTVRYPGFNAVPVTLGAALLIYGGAFSPAAPVNRLLSVRPIVFVGLISYSMYLWHWPVLAFSRYAHGDLGLVYKLAAIVVIFVLSVASYRFIEQPFRRTRAGLGPVALRQFALPGVAVISVAGALLATGGFGLYGLSPAYRDALASAPERAGDAAFVCQRTVVTPGFMRLPECTIGADYSGVETQGFLASEPGTLLWGDSHAAHHVGFVGEMADQYDFAFRNVAHGLCLPVLDRPERFSPASREADCRRSGETVRERLDLYETIILAGEWKRPLEQFDGFEAALRSTIEELFGSGKRVIVMGQVPFIEGVDEVCGRKALKLPWIQCAERSRVPLSQVETYNGIIREIALSSGAGYFDLTGQLCPNAMYSSYGGNRQLYRDPGHIGLEASVLLGRQVRRSGQETPFAALEGALGQGRAAPPPWSLDEETGALFVLAPASGATD